MNNCNTILHLSNRIDVSFLISKHIDKIEC